MSNVDVLVPVLCRPHRVLPLMRSFGSSGASGRLLFVANEGDEEELAIIDKVGAEVLIVPDTCLSWPQKINRSFVETEADWVLLGADDVHFHPGWWQATQGLRDSDKFGLIGTNDLGNPVVLRGEHATHPLISRRYALDYGTFDTPPGSGVVVHEGYRHWFVDNELVATAKLRGKWTPCLESVVEHLHPYWGKGEWDEVYELGERERLADQKLWSERSDALLWSFESAS